MRYLILLGLFGCGYKQTSETYIDPAFSSYIKTFNDKGGPHVAFSIVFATLNVTNELGVCIRYAPNDPKNTIEIDKIYWAVLSELSREQLILHELGHCVLGLNHDSTLITLGAYTNVPKSIMYPYEFGYAPYYNDYRSYYISELIH